MFLPPRTTDQEILDVLAPLLRADYEDPQSVSWEWKPRTVQTRWGQVTSAELLAEALHRGITPRLIAGLARVPGRWLIARIKDSAARAEAYRAEIAHLDREIELLRQDRALDVWRQARDRVRREPDAKTKTQIAAEHGVTRATINDWIDDGAKLAL